MNHEKKIYFNAFEELDIDEKKLMISDLLDASP